MLTYVTIMLCAVVSAGAMEYKEIEARASRFFAHREWASAGAMFTLMIHERPYVASTYGQAIVAAGMLSDTLSQIDLTHKALAAKIPIDSLFSTVERTGFSIGQTSLYEEYLVHAKSAEPWLARIIDAYLMKYYTYRQNARGMIEYSKIMLRGLPDDEKALYTLAQGYLLDGRYNLAVAVYTRIVELNPDSYVALLYLGNYYKSRAAADKSAKANGIVFLERAQKLMPTPYVERSIKWLHSLPDV